MHINKGKWKMSLVWISKTIIQTGHPLYRKVMISRKTHGDDMVSSQKCQLPYKIMKDINPIHPCQAVSYLKILSWYTLLIFIRIFPFSFSQDRTIGSLSIAQYLFKLLKSLLFILILFFKVWVLALRQFFWQFTLLAAWVHFFFNQVIYHWFSY